MTFLLARGDRRGHRRHLFLDDPLEQRRAAGILGLDPAGLEQPFQVGDVAEVALALHAVAGAAALAEDRLRLGAQRAASLGGAAGRRR
ncbi:hypothetical protein [Nannocystis pusilla]|uniref:hypothetical protein n=1 Tax=Nannocystis pusilla TaxID=889268 RepID=UPI003DA62ACB